MGVFSCCLCVHIQRQFKSQGLRKIGLINFHHDGNNNVFFLPLYEMVTTLGYHPSSLIKKCHLPLLRM